MVKHTKMIVAKILFPTIIIISSLVNGSLYSNSQIMTNLYLNHKSNNAIDEARSNFSLSIDDFCK